VFNVLRRCVLRVRILVSPNLCSITVIKTNRWVQKLEVQSCLVNRGTPVFNFVCCGTEVLKNSTGHCFVVNRITVFSELSQLKF
jgi:hypothetical protein